MTEVEQIETIFNKFRLAGEVKTQQDFAEYLNISPQTLCGAMKGKPKSLTPQFMRKIQTAYEEYFGSAVTSDQLPVQGKADLLVVPDGARGGTIGDFANSIKEWDCERIISPVKGADYAIQVTGDSMSPEYPSGCKIIIKKVDESQFIEWGKVYVLDTDNGAIIKQVRRTDNPDIVECVSLNPAYQTFTIKTNYIRGWYRILMMLALK